MKITPWLGALVLALCSAPALAQHATTSVAPDGYAREQACLTWSGGAVGVGTLVPCGALPRTPVRAGSISTAGTIASANIYQPALAQNPARLGCTIQNTSAATLRVFIGAPGVASDAAALQIPPGGTFLCASPGGPVLTDPISVASATAGSPYVVVTQ